MNCPVCDAKLRAVEKYNVEVDICPDCKGVWLDRGELDKILEIAAAGGPATQNTMRTSPGPRPECRDHDDDHNSHDSRERDYRDRDYDRNHPPRKRRGTWLADIFESFGGGGD